MSAKHEERSYLECLLVKMINAYKISIFGDSVMAYDKLIEMTKKYSNTNFSNKNYSNKAYSKSFNEKRITCKTKHFCILLAFLWISMSLLIAVSIYYCFIKHRPKQTNLLPCRDTSNKLKEININDIIWK